MVCCCLDPHGANPIILTGLLISWSWSIQYSEPGQDCSPYIIWGVGFLLVPLFLFSEAAAWSFFSDDRVDHYPGFRIWDSGGVLPKKFYPKPKL